MTLDDARRYLGIRKQVFTDQPDAARPILEWLIAEVERLQTEPTEAKAADDTELIDWLEKQVIGYGEGVVFRQSIRGYGMRLHEIGKEWVIVTANEPQPTVRGAIAHAMEQEAVSDVPTTPVD